MERHSDDQKEKKTPDFNVVLASESYTSLCPSILIFLFVWLGVFFFNKTDLTFEMISFEAFIMVSVGFTLLIDDR